MGLLLGWLFVLEKGVSSRKCQHPEKKMKQKKSTNRMTTQDPSPGGVSDDMPL
jgi:hypothetical protein